ncbi:MAG: OmpH family outer membrane protein, partial [Muribaculaceae bacterium]|nr:OmpH family outer membrane protein [Muribaculaceae bacterium]
MNKLSTLLLLALALCVASCGGDNSGKANDADSANKPEAEKFEASTNIRFVSLDSITSQYTLALEIQSKLEGIALDLQSKNSYYQNQLQQKAANIDQKMKQNMYLSEASYNQDMQQFNNLQNTYAQQYAQHESDAAKQAAALQQTLADSIQNYLTVYNNEHKYDAILYSNAAAIYNPNLDITKEIVEGLNKRYTPANPATAPAEP